MNQQKKWTPPAELIAKAINQHLAPEIIKLPKPDKKDKPA